MRRTIYLDTTLWNKLYEQSADPAGLVRSLRENGAELVFSPHLRYELSKTFRSTRPGRQEKAKPLFCYLEQFVRFRIPCAKQVVDLLREEVKCANGQVREVECFYQAEDYEREAGEIRKLARGQLGPQLDKILDFRSQQVQVFRAESSQRAAVWGELMEGKDIATFPAFLEVTFRELGPACLRKHISRLFPELRAKDIKRIARKILSAQRYRLAHALVRGDLYMDWRCYRDRALARDTSDDCYHMENAAYCALYATDDVSQEAHANDILCATKVRIYDRKIPIGEWLTSIGISG